MDLLEEINPQLIGRITVELEKVPTFLDLNKKELVIVTNPDMKVYEYYEDCVREFTLLDRMLLSALTGECIFLNPRTLPKSISQE